MQALCVAGRSFCITASASWTKLVSALLVQVVSKNKMSLLTVLSGNMRKVQCDDVASDGLILNVDDPIKCCKHDWTLYVQSGIEQQLDSVCTLSGTQ